jgi:hypothetical protein
VERGLGEGVLGDVLGLVQVAEQGEHLPDDAAVGRHVELVEPRRLGHPHPPPVHCRSQHTGGKERVPPFGKPTAL